MATYQPQSLSVIGMLDCRVPHRFCATAWHPRLPDRSPAPPGWWRWFGGPVAPAGRIADDACVQIPETRYARTVDGLSVAYQTVGRGPPDVVLLRAWHTNVEFDWEERILAHVFQRIASFGRLIVFDRRGTGLSDRIGGDLPTLEQRMDDVVAVLDAVGSPRAALIGLAAASMLTATFAATYPQRTQALVLHEPRARGSYAEDYPWSATAEQIRKHREVIETDLPPVARTPSVWGQAAGPGGR